MKEIWKSIAGRKGRYKISNLGRIYCIITEQFVIPYMICNLHSIRSIHRLVLETFIGKRPKGMVCRHLDGNSCNNKLSNLKWGTQKENIADAFKHGRLNSMKGNKNPFYGKHHSKKAKRKMSAAHKGMRLSKKHKERISRTLKEYYKRNLLNKNKMVIKK